MTIAVHISAGKREDLSDNFNFVCFSELAAAQPGSHFIFIFDTPPHPEIYLESNCTPVILSPALKNNMLRHYWYNYKITSVIQRYNVNVFITAGLTCSLRLVVPQCLVVSSQELVAAEKNLYLKKFTPAFLNKASHIFTADGGAYEILLNKYALPEKSSLLFPGLKNDSPPLSYEEREKAKNELSAGDEYFLYSISIYDFQQLKTVLKSFSIFKKWQKSSMRLALLVQQEVEPLISKELTSYKYRSDIIIFTSNTDTSALVRAAYAIVTDTADIFQTALPAMRSGVPVIADKKHKLQRSLPGAMHVEWQEKDIAAQMMNIYKDEHMRRQGVNEGVKALAKYSWKNTTEKMWQVFQNLMN